MENIQTNEELTINADIRINLDATRKWTMFLAIVGFIYLGGLIIFGFFFGHLIANQHATQPASGVFSVILGFIYLIMGIIYFFPLFYLYKFSAHTKKGLYGRDQKSINLAFRNLMAHYRYIGVLMIIGLALFGIFLLISIAANL